MTGGFFLTAVIEAHHLSSMNCKDDVVKVLFQPLKREKDELPK